MVPIGKTITRFVTDDSGLETVEYAVVGGIIAMALIITVTGIGLVLGDMFGVLAEKLGE